VVEEVDDLHAQLQRGLSSERDPLEQRGVDPPVARSRQGVAGQVSESAYLGAPEGDARRADGRGVESSIPGAAPGVRVADQVRPVRGHVPIQKSVSIGELELYVRPLQHRFDR
jgi:hypothetical protein